MSKEMKDEQIELFFPYYVNQERLLDIYAILNGGYSEFSEVTASNSTKKDKKGKAEVSFSGFKIFNFGLGASTTGEIGNSNSTNEEAKERKVHTVTSVLSMVISELKNKNYLREIEDSKPGQFVCLDVNLLVNSMSSLLSELTDVMKLMDGLQSIANKGTGNSNNKGAGNSSKDTKDVEKIAKQMKTLFDGEEIVCEREKYAVFGTVVDSNLYQSVRSDIIGTDLHCLAQVKRVFPEGTELMKNTVFSKLKDKGSKEQMIKALNDLTKKDIYDFEATIIPSIENKPVYQLEIIALYQ